MPPIATLGPGDVFGEMGILTESRRNADFRAGSDVELLALGWSDFKGLLDQSDATAKDSFAWSISGVRQSPD